MNVCCSRCDQRFDDATHWTLCPHAERSYERAKARAEQQLLQITGGQPVEQFISKCAARAKCELDQIQDLIRAFPA